MSDSADILVLAEDKPQQAFLRAALKKLKVDARLTVEPVLLGQNDGWVRTQLHQEVPRLRKAQHLRVIIAVIDADDETVQVRRSWLKQGLEPAHPADENIVYVIPRRHIETWIWYLEGNAVDEVTNYKKEKGGPVKKDHDLAVVKRRFAEYIQTGQPPFPDCPPSLQDARNELRRVFPPH